jgi:transposase
MRKLVGQELNDLEKLYQGEIEALHQENNLVCGIGEKLYTVKNVSLLKTKIKNGEQIPDSKTFTSKIS